jgi:pimeloyl-ACP methyl ester carboxylesterase
VPKLDQDRRETESATSSIGNSNPRLLAAWLVALAGLGMIAAAIVIWVERRPAPTAAPDDVTTQNAETQSAEATPPTELGGIDTIPCWFPVSTGRENQCGVLRVPARWTVDRSRMLHLRFVVFRGAARSVNDPLVYLAGGPGDPAQIDAPSIAHWWDWIDRAKWLGKRDLVVFDYRGAGLSEPNMSCPELAEAAYRVFSDASSKESAREAWSTAAGRCRDRLQASGIDLASYRTETIAEDLHSLLQLLGYPAWNFLAVSYGTRVALAFIDRWPEGTRAVILDSVYPPDSNAYVESGRAAADAFAALFKECAEDRTCHKAFPALAETFGTILRRAATTPVTIDAGAPEGPQLHLDAAELIDLLLHAFYDWRDIAELPALIAALGDGNAQPLRPLGLRMLDTYTSTRISHGLFFSVECQDEFPFNARDDIERAAAALPLYSEFILSNLPLAVCPFWPAGEPAAAHRPSHPSGIPILMLSGELDGITPPNWAKLAAKGLPSATRVQFRGVGHGVLEAHDCAGLVVERFLDNPARPPFDDCLLAMGPPPFQTAPRGR